MRIINFNSGGKGSYLTGKRAVKKYGAENVTHLFTDTKSEDSDLYRFMRESCALMGGAPDRDCRRPYPLAAIPRGAGNR